MEIEGAKKVALWGAEWKLGCPWEEVGGFGSPIWGKKALPFAELDGAVRWVRSEVMPLGPVTGGRIAGVLVLGVPEVKVAGAQGSLLGADGVGGGVGFDEVPTRTEGALS